MKRIKATSWKNLVQINWILFLILGISCGQPQTNLKENKQIPIFINLTSVSLLDSIADFSKAKEIKLLFATNLPTSSILTLEVGETINTTTREHYVTEQEISINGSSFEFVMNDSLLRAYLQLRIHKNQQNPEILCQIQKRIPKNLPVPLFNDGLCLFQTIYIIDYKWKDNGNISLEYVHDFLGAINDYCKN